MRAFIPASSNIICKNGSDILLLKRSSKAKAWPNFWAFPGWKVDNTEFFTESWLRELAEEVGIFSPAENIFAETIIFQRSNTGTKICYFGMIENWQWNPEILEKNLATDLAWFPISNLPTPMIPHHKMALEYILSGKNFTEIDILSDYFYE